ncbi:VOC family protein [Janibacter indicus]|nr:VOC family protein [Janibacter indicus]
MRQSARGDGPPGALHRGARPDSGKNKMHCDLRPTGLTQAEEVERLLAHGASLHADLRGHYGPGTGWVTLVDPEGNLFCVLRSDGELAARD